MTTNCSQLKLRSKDGKYYNTDVVVEELIPESQVGKHSNLGTIGFSLGFVLLMILDVALG